MITHSLTFGRMDFSEEFHIESDINDVIITSHKEITILIVIIVCKD